ncbi:hypothetical protein Tco_0891723 [Tanacetum coccineum]|uniref:Xylulose kinase-1 n=1 Tax=Tanacetum coccineum TaxID=301880 RepID=A0ABQ5C3S4_9ASTR
MVAYLEKSEGSEGFHQIIDFLTASHIKNALTECPTLYASPIEQFWQTAALSTTKDGVRGITATIDRKVKVFVSEASIRRHLKLEDSDGISSLPTAEIFEQLALIGFIQIFLNKRKRMLFPHKRTFLTPTLTQKLFSNMKKASKGYSGVDIPLFLTMLTTPESSPSRITSSPSLSPQTHPSTSQPPSIPQSNQTIPVTEEAAPMPHESPLQSVHSLGRDKGSLSLNELMTYHADLTKLIKRVKKLKQTIKISQARRRAKVVISDAEEDKVDPSKQGRSLIEELDLDARISLHLGVFNAATTLADAARRRQSVENVQTYTRRSRLVSTVDVSTASELGSTAGVKVKDKGKAIMQESKPPKKIKKRVQVQMSVDEELAKKSDPAVLRYHTLQNKPFSIAKVRKNMCMYLKNRGGYKLSHFKGMSYEDIRPIFERVWDQNQAFVPKDSEIEKEVMKRSGFDLQQEFVKKDEASSFVQKQPARGSRKKSLARKRARETLSEESAKKQKLEDDTEKEELQVYLNIVPEEESLNIESLATKYPIVDWETQILANDKYYYQIKRADGSVKHYKIFSAMLYDFDRQDVLELYRLVKERFQTASPEGYDLLLWGDLKTMIEPNEEDEIWRNQQDWNLIN